ncbi:unnamed protein product [Adineta ricciae]|nr:unnamed protein product [Adineta ricciae]
MAEKDNQQIRRHSTRKGRTQAPPSFFQPRKSLSSPSSPIDKENLRGNSSRGRQLWNLAVESVLEHENSTNPSSISVNSSASGNQPIGWYNLTKR